MTTARLLMLIALVLAAAGLTVAVGAALSPRFPPGSGAWASITLLLAVAVAWLARRRS